MHATAEFVRIGKRLALSFEFSCQCAPNEQDEFARLMLAELESEDR